MRTVGIVGEGVCPPNILAALQEIDSSADLIHLGGTSWWLGVRAPNPAAKTGLAHAHAKASKIPQVEDPADRAYAEVELAKELRMYQIMAEGFRPIALYEVEGSPGHDIVEDFRIRDFNFRTKSEDQIMRELKASISMEELNRPRIQRFGELAREKAAEAFRYVFKRARSFVVGAQLER